MTGLEDNPPQAVSISNITATSATMTVHLTDGSTIGPLVLPVAAFYVHGDWQPNTPYAVNDVLRYGNASYMVRIEHTSAATFDVNRVIAGETVSQLMTYGFEFRGEWHHDTQYRAYDFVRDFEGSVYIVRQSHFSAPVFDPNATNASNEPLYELVFARYVPPAQQVTIGASVSGKPSNGQVILVPVTRTLNLPADTAATAQTDIALRKNGVSIGTLRFAPAETTASFVGVGTTSFVAGDRLSFVFPASADATLANIGIALNLTGN
jgi:hypothetical protein